MTRQPRARNRNDLLQYNKLEEKKMLTTVSELPAFPTEAGMYQIYSNYGRTGQVDLENGVFKVAASNAGTKVNAAGFNVADNYAYGVYTGNYEIARIGADGTTESLGKVSGLPTLGSYYVGDFADDGLLYLRTGKFKNTLFGVNVESMTVENQIQTSAAMTNIYDIAFNRVDSKFYASQRGPENKLLSIDMDGTVENIGGNGIGPITFGAMYADADGNVFGGSNQTGDVYRFDTVTGLATRVGTGPKSGTNDGFSNSTQVIEMPPLAQDDHVEFESLDNMVGNLFADTGNGSDIDGNDDSFEVIAVNGEALTDSPVELASGATVSVTSSGDFKFTASEAANDLLTTETMVETFEYTISDDTGRSSSATAEVTIRGVNEANEVNQVTILGMDSFGGDEFERLTVIGDVNGDGYQDGFVTSTAANGGKGMGALVLGSADGIRNNFNVNDLRSVNQGDGSGGTLFSGISRNDQFGSTFTGLGDINGDGIDDFAVGATDADPNGVRNAGETYVVFGNRDGFGAEFSVANLLTKNGGNGSAGFVLQGNNAHDLSSSNIESLGDFNGDGLNDLVVSSANFDADASRKNSGQTYVVYGSDQGFDAEYRLSQFTESEGNDGSRGFVINGTRRHDLAGGRISTGGDVNGDGLDDLIIGAERADALGRWDSGQSYIIFGNNQNWSSFELSSMLENGEWSNDGNGCVINGSTKKLRSGGFVTMAGDLNGDGVTDMKIGLGDSNAEAVYTLHGGSHLNRDFEIAEFKANTTVLVDNFDSAFENFDSRTWDQFTYNVTLHSDQGTRVTIWGDPHVITTVDGMTTWFDIPLGANEVTLKHGTTISWDTMDADPSRFAEGPPLKWFSIDSNGTANDMLIDVHDDVSFADAMTGLSDGELREFARLLYTLRV